MLIGEESEPFDSPDYIFDLKLDGDRCVAYLDPEAKETTLVNKRGKLMGSYVPELANLHKQVSKKVILDGELIVTTPDGKPDFEQIRVRTTLTNRMKIERLARLHPASFVAFDMLYLDRQIIRKPVIERKQLLEEFVCESERLSVSRYIEERGIDYYNLVAEQALDGIVAKQRDSRYYMGERTKEWIKIKNQLDDDFIVTGYIIKRMNVTSLVLGQYNRSGEMAYKGHVILGINRSDFRRIESLPVMAEHPFIDNPPRGNEDAIWVNPVFVCKVKFMAYTPGGGMRHPIYKGLRGDKEAKEVIDRC